MQDHLKAEQQMCGNLPHQKFYPFDLLKSTLSTAPHPRAQTSVTEEGEEELSNLRLARSSFTALRRGMLWGKGIEEVKSHLHSVLVCFLVFPFPAGTMTNSRVILPGVTNDLKQSATTVCRLDSKAPSKALSQQLYLQPRMPTESSAVGGCNTSKQRALWQMVDISKQSSLI